MDLMDTGNGSEAVEHLQGDRAKEEEIELDEEDRKIAEEAQIMQNQFYSQQITAEEYEKQKKNYTETEVKALMQTEEYLIRANRCSSCWSIWYLGQSSHDCLECGGYPLERPCPVCDGKCQRIWTRDVESTHAFLEAHWDGECGLPVDEQRAFFIQKATEASEDVVIEGLQELST